MRTTSDPTQTHTLSNPTPSGVDEVELRQLVPRVLSVLVGRGADFATAEDAVQEALIRALSAWEDEQPADPTGQTGSTDPSEPATVVTPAD